MEIASSKEYDRKFVAELRKLKPNFLQMRSQFGVPDSVGFGSLPKSQGYHLASLIPIERSLFGWPKYAPENLFLLLGDDPFVTLNPEESRRLVVAPKLRDNRQSFLVTIFDRWGLENGENILDKDVVLGAIAHELSEWLIHLSKTSLSPKLAKVLDSQKKATDWEEPIQYHDARVEVQADLVSGTMGYKKEVISALDFLANRYRKIWATNIYGETDFETLLRNLEYRKQQVEIYCLT